VVLAEAGPEVAATFHDLLFDHQPKENTSGLPSARLVDLAIQPAQPSRSFGPASSTRSTSSGS
jgi:hypothetical protein